MGVNLIIHPKAMGVCRNDGAQLAVVTSKDEYDWLVQQYIGMASSSIYCITQEKITL